MTQTTTVGVIPGSTDQTLLQELIRRYNLNAKCTPHVNPHSDDFFPRIRVQPSPSNEYTIVGLPSVVFYLLSNSSNQEALSLLGQEKDQHEILDWCLYSVNQIHAAEVAIETARQAFKVSTASIPILIEVNHHLRDRTFVVGNTLTIADILLYHAIWVLVVYKDLDPKTLRQVNSLTRWFEHIQNTSGLRSRSKVVIQINYFFDQTQYAPLRLPKVVPPTTTATTTVTTAAPAAEEASKSAAPKKENKKGK